MGINMKAFMVLTMALSLSCELRAQGDSLVDVFPLAIGNEWTYRYFTSTEQNSSSGVQIVSDSGIATYAVVGAVRTVDSIRWVFRRTADLIHYHEINSWDTTYRVSDSAQFELVERLAGQHHLFRTDNPGLDAFPFTRDFHDTTSILRFRKVEPGDTIRFTSATRIPPSPFFLSSFTFAKDIGLLRFQYNSGTIDYTSSCHHFLLSRILTSLDERRNSETPRSFALRQNYPNPFNPTTTINYQLPTTSHVTLKVFDLLGREVATLVYEVQDGGFKSVEFSAQGGSASGGDVSGLASGIYFYRLQSGGFTETRKLILLR
jgi:hypothetical protein